MYQAIKGGDGTDGNVRDIQDLEGKRLRIHDDDGGGDVESAMYKPLFVSATNATRISRPGIPATCISRAGPPARGGRLVSLDVFRGLTVALMILVDDAGGILPFVNHSPWDGMTIADFVMPFFLFIVGVSLGLTYKKLSCKAVASKKAIFRALKLLVLGLFLQGGYFHGLNNLTYGVDIEQIRWMGILQRIAIAYLAAAVCEIWLKGDGNNVNSGLSLLRKYQLQWAVVSVLITIYLSLLYGLYVPDWNYQILPNASSSALEVVSVKCGVRGDTGPACNAVGMIDRKALGIEHLYRRPIYARTKQCSVNSPDYGPLPPDAPSWCQAPFDPEGLLSSVMAIVTCLVGLHYGHIIVHFQDHKHRVLHLMVSSTCLIALGFGLDLIGMHVNKVLYTFSYMCLTAGAAGILFAGIYVMVGPLRFIMLLNFLISSLLLLILPDTIKPRSLIFRAVTRRCAWIQAPNCSDGVDGHACVVNFYSCSMQCPACCPPGILLEEASK